MRHSLILWLVVMVVSVVEATDQRCSHAFFTQQPGWVTHAEWYEGELLLIDNLKRGVQAYKQDGRPTLSALSGIEAGLAAYPYDPLELKRQGDKWFLRLSPAHFISFELEEGYGATNPLDLVGTEVEFEEDGVTKTAAIGQIYDWVPAGGDLVLLGDLLRQGLPASDLSSWISGIIRLKLSSGKDLRVLEKGTLIGEPWSLSATTWRRHRVILPTLAAAEDGRFFFLKLDETPRIYMNRPGESSLIALEPTSQQLGAASPPDIPDVSLRRLDLVMAEVENTPFVAGLYWWEDALYVLHRAPGKSEGVRWTLTKLYLQGGELEHALLPSRVEHLVVAPGDTWAFIEKGPLLGFGNQKIPSAWFIDLKSSTDLPPVLCPPEVKESK